MGVYVHYNPSTVTPFSFPYKLVDISSLITAIESIVYDRSLF